MDQRWTILSRSVADETLVPRTRPRLEGDMTRHHDDRRLMADERGATGASPETRRLIHELRQPLAALQMWVDLMAESMHGQLGETQARYLAKVRAQVARLGEVLAASAANLATASTSDVATSDGKTPAAPVVAGEGGEPAVRAGALAGLSLLIVEDDETTAEALQLALESEGACVVVAGTIADGLALFRAASPDAVLSDLRVSDGNGLELAAEVRRIDREIGRSTVVIAVTGYDSRETRAAAREAGCDETIVKPFAVDALVATVVRLVAARRAPG